MVALVLFLVVVAQVIALIIFLRGTKPITNVEWTIVHPDGTTEENAMSLILTDSQKAKLSVSFVTAAGNPAVVDGNPVWEVATPDVVTLEPVVVGDTENPFARYVVASKLGGTQVSVKADADLGDGVKEIIGVLDVEVVAGEAVAVAISAGVPEPK